MPSKTCSMSLPECARHTMTCCAHTRPNCPPLGSPWTIWASSRWRPPSSARLWAKAPRDLSPPLRSRTSRPSPCEQWRPESLVWKRPAWCPYWVSGKRRKKRKDWMQQHLGETSGQDPQPSCALNGLQCVRGFSYLVSAGLLPFFKIRFGGTCGSLLSFKNPLSRAAATQTPMYSSAGAPQVPYPSNEGLRLSPDTHFIKRRLL
ncbi:uncharacterized protein LOC121920974 [Sceloporus undulatus]|uniref:uncharacterized protein LOC121920974 n=1 Tax=Sceloporus undulatus TaxID=8520 RepID=UPI001C4ABCBE|nr:uncharacterized protein LOC121920974 [Sceloporus undulatus]